MTGSTQDIQIARLEVQVSHLAEAVSELSTDVKALNAALNQSRGGLKVIAAASSIGGAVAGSVVTLLFKKLGG